MRRVNDGQGVVERLGAEGLDAGVAEQLRIALVAWPRPASSLIRLAVAEAAGEVLQVEAGVAELIGEELEEFRVRRRVVVAEIINGVDETAAEEVRPHPVDKGGGEIGVLRRRKPGGEGGAERGAIAQGRLIAAEEARTNDLPGGLAGAGRQRDGGRRRCPGLWLLRQNEGRTLLAGVT